MEWLSSNPSSVYAVMAVGILAGAIVKVRCKKPL
jgi:hypothetical protein